MVWFYLVLYNNLILSACAADVVILVKNQDDVNMLVDVTDKFSVVSSARVNRKKSEALAVGEWHKSLPVLPQNLAWKKDGLRYLGISSGNENWESLIEKVVSKLAKWKWLHS